MAECVKIKEYPYRRTSWYWTFTVSKSPQEIRHDNSTIDMILQFVFCRLLSPKESVSLHAINATYASKRKRIHRNEAQNPCP